MDDNPPDLEAGVISNIPRHLNKKIRKRKHLDALLKFRSTKTNSNDLLRSSEDELFLPHQKPSITKSHSSPYRRCWKYSKHILSFTLVCSFMIICIGLTYANIELKNEVKNLSSRINEIEEKFSNLKLNNISSTIQQIQTRLHFLDQFNSSLPNDLSKQQKTEFSEITNEADNLNQKPELRLEKIMIEWDNQLNSFRNEIQNLNQTTKIQELKTYLEQLTYLVHNSSDETSVILTAFQSNLDQLQSQINECKCSKESIHLKSSVVNSDRLQQSIVTKPNIISTFSTTTFQKFNNENKQTENITDVEQIVNRPSVTG